MDQTNMILNSHPLHDPFGVTINSRQIQELNQNIHRWLWTGASGGYVVGDSRSGKTTAMELIVNNIKQRDGSPLPSKIISTPKRDTSTIASVFRNLMNSFNLQIKSRDSADSMRDCVLHNIVSVVRTTLA